MDCSTPGFPVSHHLLEFAQVCIHCISNAIQLFHPLIPSSPSTFNFSQHQGLSSESAVCIRWSKYWSFSFSISPSSEYSGLISFKTDWFDLTVQGTLKSLLQHHSWKASIHWCSVLFTVQLSQPYMTPGKTITLTIWTFVSTNHDLFSSQIQRDPSSTGLLLWGRKSKVKQPCPLLWSKCPDVFRPYALGF